MSDAFGPERQTLEADLAGEHSVAWLRLVAGVLAGGAAALTLIGALPLPAFLIALTGLFVSLFWLRSALRTFALRHATTRNCLRVYERGLVLETHGQCHGIGFDEITSIEVDEERLDIVVQRRTGPALRIDPRYPGVSIEELAHLLRRAWTERGTQ